MLMLAPTGCDMAIYVRECGPITYAAPSSPYRRVDGAPVALADPVDARAVVARQARRRAHDLHEGAEYVTL